MKKIKFKEPSQDLLVDFEELAKRDASNLTPYNIVSLKNKCEFEQVEVIYDKDSLDSNLNWGYTSGIKNNATINKNLSKYKKLNIYMISGDINFTTTYTPVCCTIDLTHLTDNAYIGGLFMYNSWSFHSTTNLSQFFMYRFSVNEAKSNFATVFKNGTTSSISNDTISYIYKIEGGY